MFAVWSFKSNIFVFFKKQIPTSYDEILSKTNNRKFSLCKLNKAFDTLEDPSCNIKRPPLKSVDDRRLRVYLCVDGFNQRYFQLIFLAYFE